MDDDDDDDALELTEVVEDDTLSDFDEDASGAWNLEPEPEPPRPPPPPRPRMNYDDDALVSPRPAQAATEAFSHLANNLGAERFIGSMPISPGARTVEDVIKELLRPLLREWLDEHLPGLVERLVRQEIDKMVRRARDF